MSIQIPNPCAQKWSTMTPTAEGRHCQACNKIVVDFTVMTDEEIKDYLARHSGSRICGYTHVSQLDTAFNPFESKPGDVYRKLQKWELHGLFSRMSVWLIGWMLLLMGCTPQKTLGEIEVVMDTVPVQTLPTDTASQFIQPDTLQP